MRLTAAQKNPFINEHPMSFEKQDPPRSVGTRAGYYTAPPSVRQDMRTPYFAALSLTGCGLSVLKILMKICAGIDI